MQKYRKILFLLALNLVGLGWLTTASMAQDVTFEPLLIERQINCLLEQGDQVLGGLDGGGLLIWDRQNPAQVTRLAAGAELSGNDVTDLAWTGRHIWVATQGGGLTRITNLGTNPEYRQYASNLGSMNITAVTGAVIGNSERVYYGMDGAGVGLITDGLSGALYTAEQDGLIDNNINALQMYQGQLFVATPSGISRFSGNLFTDQNQGLTSTIVSALTLDPNGDLICGGNGGVFRWDPQNENWISLHWSGGWIRDLAGNSTQLWALGRDGASNGTIGYLDGSNWTMVTLPYPRALAVAAGQDIWVGGRWYDDQMNAGASGLAWFGRYDGSSGFSGQRVNAGLVFNADGLTFDSRGGTWVGSYGGDAMSGYLGNQITNVYQVATADNDSTGLFNHNSNMLVMAAGPEGLVYSAQYTSGVVRYDTRNGDTDIMWAGNSGLSGRFTVGMVVHPDGTLIVMHDWADAQKVEILTDPEHWRGDAHWLDVPQGADGGIGAGIGVFDALVVRNDVIWFAVDGSGLLRWDINGYSAGPEDPITWSDFSDDQWVGPFDSVPGTTNDPRQAVALALAPDGTIWYGGNGITRFSYDETFGDVTAVESYGAKTASYTAGLITGNVADLATDANGDLWVATRAGLNRVRWGTEEPAIDAYFDLANYFSNSAYALLYSPNVISGLPGGIYRGLEVSKDGLRVAISSSQGATAWNITSAPASEAQDMAALYCYPNPWTPGGADTQLKLGGLAADAVNGDPALVEIYNLQGQVVYRNSYVSGDLGFWNGDNRRGQPVATGLYVLKVQWQGQSATRTLAVVR